MCGKRCYPSERDAREAHRRVAWRYRVYWCDECEQFHVTNGEKRLGRDGEDYFEIPDRPAR